MKKFLSIKEQVDLLESRNLTVKNREEMEDFLKEHNYYRVSGYSLTLRKDDRFYDNATSNKLIEIYECDREMRNILFEATEIIEIKIKSLFAYYFCKKNDPLSYDDLSYYKNEEEVSKIVKKSEELKEKWKIHELYIRHYEETGEKIPLWAYVDLYTMTDISKLYLYLNDDEIKSKIAVEYGFTQVDILDNALRSIAVLRNMCAHGVRLYNKSFITKPRLSKNDKLILRREESEIIFNKLFSYVLLIKRLLKEEQFSVIKNRIVSIEEKYSLVNFRYYGFNDSWKDLI